CRLTASLAAEWQVGSWFGKMRARDHRPDARGTCDGTAPERSGMAAPRSRPDRPGGRAAAGCRGARPRAAKVAQAPQPRVPARLRGVAVQLSHDAAHRTGHGAAAWW